MKDDAQDVAGGKRRPLKPINLRGPRPPDKTGFLIIRLKRGRTINQDSDLATAAEEAGLSGVSETLTRFSLTAHSLIDSDTAQKLRPLEENASGKRFAPKHSLSDYWRVDVRQTPERVDEIEEALRRLPDVDLVYREKTVSDPVAANDDPFSGSEEFLDPAPVGVDARWVWTQPHGDGSGMHFIDLEQGWRLHHEDLPRPTLPGRTLIFNDNRPDSSNHGTAVLGIVAGVDNALGVIGIAPKVTSVRTVSHWKKDCDEQYIAQALAAAALAQPPPHVILIEAQIGAPELPVETDSGTLTAIQLAVANGIIVVEAAGNGDQDLDTHLTEDSGAIIVGAGTKGPDNVHNRSIWDDAQGSNYGSGVHCYAWGDSIVSAGYGDRTGFGNTSYTNSFGGTSGASAIIAGCALLLQGLHVAAHGSPMSPEDMRNLLSNPTTGTAQGPDVEGHIGVMPDLKKIVESM